MWFRFSQMYAKKLEIQGFSNGHQNENIENKVSKQKFRKNEKICKIAQKTFFFVVKLCKTSIFGY